MGQSSAKAWESCYKFPFVDSNAALPVQLKKSAKMRMPDPFFQMMGKPLIEYRKLPQNHYRTLYNSCDYAPNAFASSLHNEKLAVAARILKETQVVDVYNQFATPGATYIDDFVSFVKDNFSKLFRGWRKVHPVSFEDYLKNSNASENVKRILRETKVKLDEQGVGYDKITHNDSYRWTRRSAFVKIENNLYRSPLSNADFRTPSLPFDVARSSVGVWNDNFKSKAPRLISGATPEFICIMGPFFMALQTMIKKLWGKHNFVYFTSGATNYTISEYLFGASGISGNILEDDVSSFDASILPEICKLELWMTKKFGASPLVYQLFEANNFTHGQTHHGIKYKVNGTRKSGDPWTSLYNSVLNALMHLYAFKISQQNLGGGSVDISYMRSHIRMVVQGDDNLMIHTGRKMPFIKTVLSYLGFDCECIYRHSIYDAEFCNNIVYDTESGPLFGPKVGRVLCKLGYFVNPPMHIHPKSVLRGVALGFEAVATYVPLMKEVVERILYLTRDYNPYFMRTYDFKMHYKKAVATNNDYVMYNRYGVYPSMLDEMKSLLTRVENLNHPYFILLFDRDTNAKSSIF